MCRQCGRRQESHDPLIEPFLQWAASPSLCVVEWKWPGNEGMALLYCTLNFSDSDIDSHQPFTIWETDSFLANVSSLCQCACAVRQRPNTDNIPYPHMPQTLLSFQQQRSVSPRRAAQHQAVPASPRSKDTEEEPGLDPDTAQKEDHGTKACLKTSHVLI